MSDWRDRRSLGLLFLGLFFLLQSIRPIAWVESTLAGFGIFLRPAPALLAPLDFLYRGQNEGIAPKNAPDPKLPFEKESEFLAPKDPSLFSRRAVFAGILEKGIQSGFLILAAGTRDGVGPGMAGVVGDSFVGIVTRVEESRSWLMLPTDPSMRLAARSGELRFVSVGTRAGRIRLEMLSDRHLTPDGEVFLAPEIAVPEEARGERNPESEGRLALVLGQQAAAGARLGRIVADGRKNGSGWISPAVDFRSVSAVWLLDAEPRGKIARIAFGDPYTLSPASVFWADPSPRGESLLLAAEPGEPPKLGAPLIVSGRLLGKVIRVNGRIAWGQLLGDPAFEVERLLVTDQGEVVNLGRGGVRAFPSGISIQTGWLFTGAGDPEVPKGIRIARVVVGQGRISIETGEGGAPEICQIVRLGGNP